MNSNKVLYVKSSKKKNRQNTDETSSKTDDDVWDDTVLIEAYDKAVQLAHDAVLDEMQSSGKEKDSFEGKKKGQWSVGDKCRCQFSEDHKYYEADIVQIIESKGMCVVKYLGYENEEQVPLRKLKPSKGEIQRSLQIQQAKMDSSESKELFNDRESAIRFDSKTHTKKNNGKRAGKSKSSDSNFLMNGNFPNSSDMFNFPSMGMTIPPPPPLHMFNSSSDISESEAMSAMLMSWYMSGFHTGFYQGLKFARRKNSRNDNC